MRAKCVPCRVMFTMRLRSNRALVIRKAALGSIRLSIITTIPIFRRRPLCRYQSTCKSHTILIPEIPKRLVELFRLHQYYLQCYQHSYEILSPEVWNPIPRNVGNCQKSESASIIGGLEFYHWLVAIPGQIFAERAVLFCDFIGELDGVQGDTSIEVDVEVVVCFRDAVDEALE